MRTARDVESRRKFLVARLENYRIDREKCSPSQRDLFDMLIRNSESELARVNAAVSLQQSNASAGS
jgi:hypothetical protein